MEQKKMFKTGLNIARFRQHVPLIEEETVDYFKRWGNSGERGDYFVCTLLDHVHLLPNKLAHHFYDSSALSSGAVASPVQLMFFPK